MRRRAWATIAAIAAVQAVAVTAYLRVEQGRHEPGSKPFLFERLRKPMSIGPNNVELADGRVVALSQGRGTTVLLHFWATWCPQCREELPDLLQLGRDHPNLEVIALSLDTDWAVVHDFFGANIPAEVVRDPSGELAKVHEVGALPDTYLLRDGVVSVRFGGTRSWSSREARKVIEQLIAAR